MTPPPGAPAQKKKVWAWLAFGGALVCGCCLLTAICGALGSAGVSKSAPPASAAGVSAVSGSADDDVITYNEHGLAWVAPMRVVGPQVLSGDQLLGAWREDRQDLGLQLGPGDRYEMVYSTQGRGRVALGYEERGSWALDQGNLTLTPESLDFSGVVVTAVSEKAQPGPPRTARLEGVILEYQPHGVGPLKRIDGLHLVGPKPSWFYGPAQMDVTLRRAPTLK